MILTIDIGNTNMEFGVFDKEMLTARFRLSTNRDITSDEMGLMVRQFFAVNNIDHSLIKDVVVGTVVPQVMYSVFAAMKKYFGLKPLVVGEDIPISIPNLYGNPGEVGADRLINAFAAVRLYGAPGIVLDFGTATTFDVISHKGEYLGGVIYPGIKLSIAALSQNAAKLPKIELVLPERSIGKTTAESMQAGVVYGYVGAVKNIIEAVAKEMCEDNAAEKIKVIGTGGLSALINEAAPDIFFDINKTLTLQGLNMIYRGR